MTEEDFDMLMDYIKTTNRQPSPERHIALAHMEAELRKRMVNDVQPYVYVPYRRREDCTYCVSKMIMTYTGEEEEVWLTADGESTYDDPNANVMLYDVTNI